MKAFTPKELTQMSAAELIDKMTKGELSIVGAFKRKKLLRELWAGKTGAKFIIWLSQLHCKDSDGATKRKALSKSLKRVAPYVGNGRISENLDETGAIFAFNHPSLGEILRLIEYCTDNFPKKQMLFPVTIAWFEALAPKFEFLKSIGITITPTITPTAVDEILNGKDTFKEELSSLTSKLTAYYLELVQDTLEHNGIVLVAPSATRKQFIFDSEAQKNGEEPIEPQTLSLIVTQLKKAAPALDYLLYPICVVPPDFYSTGLNLFEKYTLSPCAYFNSCEAQHLATKRVKPRKLIDAVDDSHKAKHSKAPRKLEYDFLMQLADCLCSLNRPLLVTRPDYIPDVVDIWKDYS